MDNDKVVFNESKLNDSFRRSNFGWGSRVSTWVVGHSRGMIKTEQDANNVLIIFSLIVIVVSIFIAIFAGK